MLDGIRGRCGIRTHMFSYPETKVQPMCDEVSPRLGQHDLIML